MADTTESYKQRISELESLYDLSRTLLSKQDLDDVLTIVCDSLARLLDLGDAHLLFALRDTAHDTFTFPLAIEWSDNKVIDLVRCGKRQIEYRTPGHDDETVEQLLPRVRATPPSPEEWIVQRQESLLMSKDVEKQTNSLGIQTWPTFGLLKRPVYSFLGVPLQVGDNAIGAVSIRSFDQKSHFTNRHLALLTSVADLAALAIDNAQALHQVPRDTSQLQRIMREIAKAKTASAQAALPAGLTHRLNNLAGAIPVRVAMLRERLRDEIAQDPNVSKYLDGIAQDARDLLQAASEYKEQTLLPESTSGSLLAHTQLLHESLLDRYHLPPKLPALLVLSHLIESSTGLSETDTQDLLAEVIPSASTLSAADTDRWSRAYVCIQVKRQSMLSLTTSQPSKDSTSPTQDNLIDPKLEPIRLALKEAGGDLRLVRSPDGLAIFEFILPIPSESKAQEQDDGSQICADCRR